MKLSVRKAAPFTAATAAAAALVFGLVLTLTEGAASAQVIQIAPPAARVEAMSPAPSPHHVWFPGYWGWRRGYGVDWVGGRWDVGRPGHVWAAPEWRAEGRRWRFVPGRWHRR